MLLKMGVTCRNVAKLKIKLAIACTVAHYMVGRKGLKMVEMSCVAAALTRCRLFVKCAQRDFARAFYIMRHNDSTINIWSI